MLMLQNTLMDLRDLLNSTSNVVCSGHHHNHVIHAGHLVGPVDSKSEPESDYGGFWGENVLESATAEKPVENVEETDGGRLFANVVRKNSFFSDIKKVGLNLSFAESVASASSGSSFDGRGDVSNHADDSDSA